MSHTQGIAKYPDNQLVFQVEFNPTPSLDTQEFFLVSGIVVTGVVSWVERFAKAFQNSMRLGMVASFSAGQDASALGKLGSVKYASGDEVIAVPMPEV